jgi:hypothetical protein
MTSPLIVASVAAGASVKSWCQFHQHFMSTFCAKFLVPKNYKLLTKAAQKNFCTKKAARKIMVKLTPGSTAGWRMVQRERCLHKQGLSHLTQCSQQVWLPT